MKVRVRKVESLLHELDEFPLAVRVSAASAPADCRNGASRITVAKAEDSSRRLDATDATPTVRQRTSRPGVLTP